MKRGREKSGAPQYKKLSYVQSTNCQLNDGDFGCNPVRRPGYRPGLNLGLLASEWAFEDYP